MVEINSSQGRHTSISGFVFATAPGSVPTVHTKTASDVPSGVPAIGDGVVNAALSRLSLGWVTRSVKRHENCYSIGWIPVSPRPGTLET